LNYRAATKGAKQGFVTAIEAIFSNERTVVLKEQRLIKIATARDEKIIYIFFFVI